jgi:hypothetical protein
MEPGTRRYLDGEIAYRISGHTSCIVSSVIGILLHPAWVKSRLESDKTSRVTLDGWMQLIIIGRCDVKRKPQSKVWQGSVRGEAASGIAWRGISEE